MRIQFVLLVFVSVALLPMKSDAIYSSCPVFAPSCVACAAPVCCCSSTVVVCQDNSQDGSGGFCHLNGGGNGSLGCTSANGIGPGACSATCVQVIGGIDQCTGLPALPPSGACGIGTICGHVTSTEAATPLRGMSVNLRSTLNNQIVTSTVTDATGFYSFAVTPGSAYRVNVALSRGESSIPAAPLVHETFQADFAVRGVRSIVNVTATTPGSFVILTQNPISAGNPPAQRAGRGEAAFSAVWDGVNQTRLYPTAGSYYLTCWTHANGVFSRTQSQFIGLLSPQTEATIACQ